MNYIYGPVRSRRLGMSLGVNITPGRACSLDCIYCEEARPTSLHTLQRQEYAPTQTIIDQVKNAAIKDLDYITFSGSGEPTMHSGLGEILAAIKDLPVPSAVITNSSLLHQPQVREELKLSDLVVPSLDAVTEAVFQRVNRPCPGLSAEMIVQGLREFAKEYKGQVWLEVLLVKGLNDHPAEVKKIARVANGLNLAKVQLNTVSRATTVPGTMPVEKDTLISYARLFTAPTEVFT